MHFQVLFRIHHSLGDGVALLRLFLETIADREHSKKNLWAHCVRARQKLKTYFENDFTTPKFEQKFSIWKSISSLNAREFQRLWNRFKSFLLHFAQNMAIFFMSPASIIHQGFFKKIDENCLHRQKLTGEKVNWMFFPVCFSFSQYNIRIIFQIICWRFEDDDDLDLLDTMKSIKRNFQGVRFSDVLLSALSISFQNYFESKGDHIPNTMTVVVPARIEAEGLYLFKWISHFVLFF